MKFPSSLKISLWVNKKRFLAIQNSGTENKLLYAWSTGNGEIERNKMERERDGGRELVFSAPPPHVPSSTRWAIGIASRQFFIDHLSPNQAGIQPPKSRWYSWHLFRLCSRHPLMFDSSFFSLHTNSSVEGRKEIEEKVNKTENRQITDKSMNCFETKMLFLLI